MDAAILVLSRSKTLQQDVNPKLHIEKVRELAATPVNRDMMTKAGGQIHEPTLILSWRKNLNWNGIPILLLDASGEPENSAMSATELIAEIPTGFEKREPAKCSKSTSTAGRRKSMAIKPPL